MGFNLGEAVGLSRSSRWPEHRYPLSLAALTTFRLVLELLVVKEELFPGGENELTPTVDALQHLVLKLHLRLAPFARFHAPLRGEKNLRRYEEKTGLSISPSNFPMDSAHHVTERTWVQHAVVDAGDAYEYE